MRRCTGIRSRKAIKTRLPVFPSDEVEERVILPAGETRARLPEETKKQPFFSDFVRFSTRVGALYYRHEYDARVCCLLSVVHVYTGAVGAPYTPQFFEPYSFMICICKYSKRRHVRTLRDRVTDRGPAKQEQVQDIKHKCQIN